MKQVYQEITTGLLFSVQKLNCGAYNWVQINEPKNNNRHDHNQRKFDNIKFYKLLNKNEIMLPTKENLIKCYKNYPSMRSFLLDLYGQFIPENELQLIELQEQNSILQKQLEHCNSLQTQHKIPVNESR